MGTAKDVTAMMLNRINKYAGAYSKTNASKGITTGSPPCEYNQSSAIETAARYAGFDEFRVMRGLIILDIFNLIGH